MLLDIAWAALRRRPFSFLSTLLLGLIWSSLLGAAAPLAVLLWACLALLGLGGWYTLEAFVLRRLGARPPSRIESERLASALRCSSGARLVVVDQPEVWLYPSLRHIVLSHGALDLLEERELVGLVAQAVAQQRLAGLVGEPVVWLGNLLLVGAWLLDSWLIRLGELLAAAVGASLVLPALLWPRAFRTLVGRLFGWSFIGLVGASLISEGVPGLGLALLAAPALVPGLRALLAWESRRAEALADRATLEAGLGWYLLDALELLSWAGEPPPPGGAFAVLHRPGSTLTTRSERIWQQLNAEPKR
jgi:hypothetical protein